MTHATHAAAPSGKRHLPMPPASRVCRAPDGHPPGVAGWLLVVLCGVAGLYCLVLRRRCQEAGREAVMGLGMAVMGLPGWVFAPPGWWWAAYVAVFGTEAARAAWALRGGGPRGCHAHHLVGSLAMVYMALPADAAQAAQGASGAYGHAAHGSGGVPLLTGALLVYHAVWTLRAGARLVPAPAHHAAPPLAPAAAPVYPAPAPAPPAAAGIAACRVAMALAMVVMLAGGHAGAGAR